MESRIAEVCAALERMGTVAKLGVLTNLPFACNRENRGVQAGQCGPKLLSLRSSLFK